MNDVTISNKSLREQREFESLYKNPKYARAAWAEKVYTRWSAEAQPPIQIYDDKGNLSVQSQVENAVWSNLLKEFERLGISRKPTNGEMTEACQDYYSRHNSSVYVARRDSMGAKPIDETKQQVQVDNPLEGMTDEELFVMQKALEDYRNKQSNTIEYKEEDTNE